MHILQSAARESHCACERSSCLAGADVSSTATDASRVGVNRASVGPSGRILAPGAIAGIVVVRPSITHAPSLPSEYYGTSNRSASGGSACKHQELAQCPPGMNSCQKLAASSGKHGIVALLKCQAAYLLPVCCAGGSGCTSTAGGHCGPGGTKGVLHIQAVASCNVLLYVPHSVPRFQAYYGLPNKLAS